MPFKTTTTAFLSSTSCLGVIYVVSTLLSSPSLALILFHTVHLDRLGHLPEETVRFYVAEISSALAFLHENHIMHRYFSPPFFFPPFILS